MTTKDKTIDSARVEDLLARYGADTARFPAAERDAAEARLGEDESLRAALAEATALDALLTESTCPDPSAGLMRRVAEIPLRHPKPLRNTQLGEAEPPLRLLRAAFAGLFAAALGVAVGLQSLPADFSEDTSAAVSVSDDELVTLAFADDFIFDVVAEEGSEP